MSLISTLMPVLAMRLSHCSLIVFQQPKNTLTFYVKDLTVCSIHICLAHCGRGPASLPVLYHVLCPFQNIKDQLKINSDKTESESSVQSSTSEVIPCQFKAGLKNLAVQLIVEYDVPNPEEAWIAPVTESKSDIQLHNIDLLPLLCEVVCMTKSKDVEALNMACTGVLGLSHSYSQATREATSVIDTADSEEVESLRSKLVSLTPLLVQTAQETAMSSAKSTDSIYKHSTDFSDLIKNARRILLPVAGMWYHAVYSMFQKLCTQCVGIHHTGTHRGHVFMCRCRGNL